MPQNTDPELERRLYALRQRNTPDDTALEAFTARTMAAVVQDPRVGPVPPRTWAWWPLMGLGTASVTAALIIGMVLAPQDQPAITYDVYTESDLQTYIYGPEWSETEEIGEIL